MFCTSECLKTPQDLVKIYLHESNRVYRDKMVEDRDFATFDKLQSDTARKFYEVRRRVGGGSVCISVSHTRPYTHSHSSRGL